MPNIEDFRAIGTMTMRNLGKATVKYSCLVFYFVTFKCYMGNNV